MQGERLLCCCPEPEPNFPADSIELFSGGVHEETMSADRTNNNEARGSQQHLANLDFQPRESKYSQQQVGYIIAEDRVRKLKRTTWNPVDFLLGTRLGHCIILFILFIVLILSGALCWKATGGLEDMYDDTYYQSFWFSWGMFFDPGTQMGFPPDSAVKFKMTAIAFSVGGFTYNLLILGLIVETARVGLDSLHKNRNRIVENGHSLVLGWSEKTLFLLREMSAAATNRGNLNKIVVLAEEDPAVMWAEVRRHFPSGKDRGRFICRKGSPYECDDLEKASAKSARDIVVLGSKRRARESDLDAVRALVALAALPDPPAGNIIAEVRQPESAQVIRSILNGAEGMLARDPVNRVLALMALDPIVGDCFSSLFSFLKGEEFYCKNLQDMSPAARKCKTFGEVSRAVQGGICVGVNPPDKLTILSPPDDYPLATDDKIVVLAESEQDLKGPSRNFASLYLSSQQDHDDENTLTTQAVQAYSGKRVVIIVGWAVEMGERLMILDEYAPEGTIVHILAKISEFERTRRLEVTLAGQKFENIELVHHEGSTTSVRKLASLPLPKASAIIVMADMQDTDAAEADAACLGCAVTLNRICEGLLPEYAEQQSRARIICEVQDPRTERVLELKGGKLPSAATFFHSSALETGIFAMASNDAAVLNTLLILLQPQRPKRSFAAVPVPEFLEGYEEQDPMKFSTIWDAGRSRGEIVVGWHHKSLNMTTLNPDKDEPTNLTDFDQVVVIRDCGGGGRLSTT